MNNRSIFLIILVAILQPFSLVNASPLLLQSKGKPATVLELYTSQGCSSCPPAERWLSSFVSDEDLWTGVIPINFHVDYWDYLGWKDPFARAEFTTRQRNYQQLGHSRNVATPGFIVNGKGWNGWFRQRPVPVDGGIEGVDLKALIDGQHARVTFDITGEEKTLVHIAILGFGIKTPIKYGENRGRELQHDFVVIGYGSRLVMGKDGKFLTNVILPKTLDTSTTRQGVVVWVSETTDIAPLHAVAGWL